MKNDLPWKLKAGDKIEALFDMSKLPTRPCNKDLALVYKQIKEYISRMMRKCVVVSETPYDCNTVGRELWWAILFSQLCPETD